MSQLNSIIASILSDINEAKAKADQTSSELARTYAADKILRYFPVPRINIENLEVEIKYAVNSVEEKPIDNAATRKKVNDFIKTFTDETASSVKKAVENVTKTNELYEGISKIYPSKEWELSLKEKMSDILVKSFKPNDPSKTKDLAANGLRNAIPDLLPVVKRSSSMAIVPTDKGDFRLMGLDDQGKSEFLVDKEYDSEAEALKDAKALTSSLKSKKVEVTSVKKDENKKVEIGALKAGNRTFNVLFGGKSINDPKPKASLEKAINIKAEVLNKPQRDVPNWLKASKPAMANINPEKFEDDVSLKLATEKVINERLPLFEQGINDIMSKNMTTVLNVNVDGEAIKNAQPETISTIKFSLSAQDFTLLDDDQEPIL
ncbi:hypothetical protein [Algoriphagus sediminis]|uniref:Uncharacterized protein n=1 Tax=Algoriphagus sediminis TaxID=3057113 RepID=A0ABT7YEV6_9BACT|nr:hypothetical protein [Algoriphagus sediminis]MDN3205032.1 hypothetical protein [Algoriphagus sediminis]